MELRWYQQEAVDAFYRHLFSTRDNPLIVLPTGSGKSVVIAEICRIAREKYNGKSIVLAHRKELLEQNASKISALLPFGMRCGLFSAGLRSRDNESDVVCAGIQSVYEKAELFQDRRLILVDEAHLVPKDGEGMYRGFIDDMWSYNSRIRLGGLTATPFRLDSGMLCHEDGPFHNVCYSAKISAIASEGYLCKLTNKPSSLQIDTSELHIRAGEFIAREMEDLFDESTRTRQVVSEIVANCRDRRSVLVFTASVSHAEHVQKEIETQTGSRAGLVTGETSALFRETTLDDFACGRLKYLVNVNVLTTGFDSPRIDAIAIVRATCSPGLFFQMVGRGMRVYPGKDDCLILDFGENLKRHGPIDSDMSDSFAIRDELAEPGEAPTVECPGCQSIIPANTLRCKCGFLFERLAKWNTTPDTESQVVSDPIWYLVTDAKYTKHIKRGDENIGKPPTMRVTYSCVSDGNIETTISEWVCIEHTGFARGKAVDWWRNRTNIPMPVSVDDAIDIADQNILRLPHTIKVMKDGRFDRIVSSEYNSEIEECHLDECECGAKVWSRIDDFLPKCRSCSEVPF